ncbi:adenylate/guanylate cyclase domain-containing protein [Synechocystis sp. PCC 7509]|uniref:adenylate/guanylate cyclase domain-containing protein n=1 Tax=Synechocystis sp. PCC 7509 TaxID=927677 RepID=UPI0002ABBFCA|nr:adenylate/guanylate cyclase domain-containing protein [Synechocystis sp. PCC 7509]
MSNDIPAAILNYLSNLILENRSLAYLLLTKDGYLLEWGGNLSAYGIDNLQIGKLGCKQFILLEGLLPLNNTTVVLPATHIEPGMCADIHMFPSNQGDWVLLLDVRIERDRYQLMQQKGNDLSLLRSQQAKIINHYFGKEVKENLAQGLLTLNEQGDRRDITILSTKICDFTAYSEHNSPEQTLKTLNLYLSSIVQSVLDEAGMIDKIIGDTTISLFGILPSTGYPPVQAIATAFQILKFIQEINHRRQPDINLEVGITITSGFVALGLIGSKANKTFFAIGHPVDLSTHLKSKVKPREILIDENTFNRINDMQKYFLESTNIKSAASASIKTYSCRTK